MFRMYPELSPNEILNKPSNNVLNCLILDAQFNELYEYFKAPYHLKEDFTAIDPEIQANILSKAFFILKSEKEDLYNKIVCLNQEIEVLNEKYNNVLNSKKYEKRHSSYEAKCEMDNLKLKVEKEKITVDKLKEDYKIKKEELSEKKNYYINTIEENDKIIQNLNVHIEDLTNQLNEQDKKYKEEIKKIYLQKIELVSLNSLLLMQNKDLIEKHDKLLFNFKEIVEINKKLEDKRISGFNDNYSLNEGIYLDTISLMEKESTPLSDKPEKITIKMKIDTNKLSSARYATQRNSTSKFNIEWLNNYNTEVINRTSLFSNLCTKADYGPESTDQVNSVEDISNLELSYDATSVGNLEADQSVISCNEVNCSITSFCSLHNFNSNCSKKF